MGEVKALKSELQKSHELMEEHTRKIEHCQKEIDARNVRLALLESDVAVKQQGERELQEKVASSEKELIDRRKSRMAVESAKDQQIKELTDKINSMAVSAPE